MMQIRGKYVHFNSFTDAVNGWAESGFRLSSQDRQSIGRRDARSFKIGECAHWRNVAYNDRDLKWYMSVQETGIDFHLEFACKLSIPFLKNPNSDTKWYSDKVTSVDHIARWRCRRNRRDGYLEAIPLITLNRTFYFPFEKFDEVVVLVLIAVKYVHLQKNVNRWQLVVKRTITYLIQGDSSVAHFPVAQNLSDSVERDCFTRHVNCPVNPSFHLNLFWWAADGFLHFVLVTLLSICI